MDKNTYFEHIYSDYYASIEHFLYSRIHNKQSSEDIANDVFLAAYRNLDFYDARKSFITTWLYVIAENRLKNYYKKQKHLEYSYEEIVEEKGEVSNVEDETVHRKELRLVLDGAMSNLPERNQNIIRMKFYNDMTSNEIGKFLGISPGNVRIILKRSLLLMKGNLQNEFDIDEVL